jgi:phosphoadenosine phosphosulfate reductase
MPGTLVTGRRHNIVLDCKELSRATEQLEGGPPQDILRWAIGVYGEELTLSVSFGNPEGMVLLDMLSRVTDRVRVFTLDTGFLFEETVEFREEVMERYPFPVEVVRPELSVEEQVERYGEEMRSCSPDLCCQVRKLEPQRRWLKNYSAWMTGIRRDQTSHRVDTPGVGWDEYFGVAKICPLTNCSAGQIEKYVQEHDVPLNPLLERGYRSIGCEPQTRPVGPGEDARAGRWPGTEKNECGIHVVNGKVKRANP